MSNVVPMHEETVYDDIVLFLKEMKTHSSHTASAYEKGIRDFFQIVKEKAIEHLTINDLKLKKRDILFFRQYLIEKGYSNLTINNKVTGLKMLLEDLIGNEYKISTDCFSGIKRLNENAQSYDAFSVDEVLRLSELALDETHNGKIKSLFILFALDTCIRKDAILNLKWKDLKVQENGEVLIVGIDKGDKEYRTKIQKEFYEELLTIRTESEFIFDINKRSIDVMMPRLIKQLNVSDERNLVFHSIRKTGVTFKYRVTGDIKTAQKAAGHSNPALTLKTYVQEQDYGIMGAVSNKFSSNQDILDNLTLDQWNLLKESLNQDIKLILTQKAKELFV